MAASASERNRKPDGFGNLIRVEEPNPGTGAHFITTYGYNLLNQIKTASMSRGSVTQNRAWNYDSAHRLTSFICFG